jgi:hypothetical protein
MRKRDIFLVAMSEPILMNHLCVEARRNFPRPIIRAGIDHHDFFGQVRRAFQTARDVAFFIVRDNRDREREWHRQAFFSIMKLLQ